MESFIIRPAVPAANDNTSLPTADGAAEDDNRDGAAEGLNDDTTQADGDINALINDAADATEDEISDASVNNEQLSIYSKQLVFVIFANPHSLLTISQMQTKRGSIGQSQLSDFSLS
jgi:hypothetical protein